MGYLTLSRHEGEQIRLTIDPGDDTEKLLHLLRDGITINMGEIGQSQVKISIEAPTDGWCCAGSSASQVPQINSRTVCVWYCDIIPR